MERGAFHKSVLRDDRKVVAPVDFAVFSGFVPFTASVSEAVFLCPASSFGVAQTASFSRISHPFPTPVSMNDTTPARQMVADIRPWVPFQISRANIS